MLGIILLLIAIFLFIQKEYYGSLLIFFGFITQGYLIVPPIILLAGSPIEKTADLSVIYLVIISIYRFTTLINITRNENLFKWILLFVCFIVIDAFYSYKILNYDVVGITKVFRHYLIFLSFGVLIMVPVNDLLRTWHTVAIITVIQCILYLLQLPTGTVLLGLSDNTVIHNMENIGWIRYYNTPTFLIPTFFYYSFMYRCRSKALHWSTVGLLTTTIIAPMHRSYMLVILLVISLYIISQKSYTKRLVYIAILVIVGYAALMIKPTQTRLDEGLNDINNTFKSDRSLATIDYNTEDTFGYRMAHLFERINYILEKPERIIFGVGLLSEDTIQASKLPFEAGLYNERIGRISQVDTGDITWSLLILYMGFTGTLLFLLLHFRFIKYFYQHRSVPLSVVGMLMLITTLLLSFTGTELIQTHFRAITILLLVSVIKLVKTSYVTASLAKERPMQNTFILPSSMQG